MEMRQEYLNKTFDDSDEDNEEKRTLFCANLDERVTEDLLYEVFLQAGPIESARIPKDQNGRQRTFGFITYVHKCTLPYAMQLYQGLSLFRKTLNIKYNLQPPTPTNNYNSPGFNNSKHFSYDNSSLRGDNYTSNYNSPPRNPFRTSGLPDFPVGSKRKQENISKHASSERRPHKNSSPYQRNSTSNEDRPRDHNKRRQYSNGSNRHSDQRSGSKQRR